MSGSEIKEFLDKLYCGEELVFEYKGRKYFLQGWVREGNAKMVLDIVDENPFQGYCWQTEQLTMKQCADEFLNTKIWRGQTLNEIVDEIQWSDW